MGDRYWPSVPWSQNQFCFLANGAGEYFWSNIFFFFLLALKDWSGKSSSSSHFPFWWHMGPAAGRHVLRACSRQRNLMLVHLSMENWKSRSTFSPALWRAEWQRWPHCHSVMWLNITPPGPSVQQSPQLVGARDTLGAQEIWEPFPEITIAAPHWTSASLRS